MRARALPWLLALAAPAVAQNAAAANPPDRAQCASAYEQGQRLKLKGALLEARQQLAVCARDPCPASLQPECMQWLEEIGRAVPTIVPEALGADGTDRQDVRVSIDGRVGAERLDGTPLEVDPGEHVLRFEASGETPQEVRLVAIEGQKLRRLQVSFAHPLRQTSTPPESIPQRVERPVPLATWIAGSVAVAALGSFAVFGIKGAIDHGNLDACRGGCPPSQVDSDRTELQVADVSLAVAVVAAGVAAVFFFTRPEVHVPPALTGTLLSF